MDIEKLIHCLQCCSRVDAHNTGCDACDLEYCEPECQQLCETAAAALSTLRAENERLLKELEYEQEHANAYHEECGQWEAETTQLKEKLEALKQDRDAIEQDFRAFAKQWWEEDSGFPCRWCKFKRQGGCEWKVKHPGEICAGRAFEWRGP